MSSINYIILGSKLEIFGYSADFHYSDYMLYKPFNIVALNEFNFENETIVILRSPSKSEVTPLTIEPL